ncbi:MAG: phosphoenolpyruvate carboxylase [Methanobacteriota archaeon]
MIIPLLESVESLLKAKETILSCINKMEIDRESFRVFIGKSDAALFSGHIASALACKFAIQRLRELENYYPSLESDLRFAHRFLDIEVARDFLPSGVFELIQEDIMNLHAGILIQNLCANLPVLY